jgi:glycosyltransferase XagB
VCDVQRADVTADLGGAALLGAESRPAGASVVEPPLFGLGRPSPTQLAFRPSRRMVLLAAAALALWLGLTAPRLVGSATLACMAASLLLATSYRTWVLTAVVLDRRNGPEPVARLPDDRLPSYSVLVPLYREAEMVGPLVRHLARLDYPFDRLEILLLCEPDDTPTITRVGAAILDARFRLVVCPEGLPRTKPRACNIGLLQARGELCVIFDAEDRPAVDQLRRAAELFAASEPDVACLQARLDYHNHAHNWLTRCFTVEYNSWFRLLLDGLERAKLPIPLGGTSNHLKAGVLRELGGWDPYNVTEDADLGMRLHLSGALTRVLDSVTLEEACARPAAWIRQRTRWMKGFLQTWRVHARRAHGLGRGRTAATVHLLMGGTPLGNLFAPLLLIATATLAVVPSHATAVLPRAVLLLVAGTWIVGTALSICIALLAVVGLRRWHLLPAALSVPLYGLLMSVATYRAVFQLLTRPHAWEKTPHGLSGRDTDPAFAQQRPVSVAHDGGEA